MTGAVGIQANLLLNKQGELWETPPHARLRGLRTNGAQYELRPSCYLRCSRSGGPAGVLDNPGGTAALNLPSVSGETDAPCRALKYPAWPLSAARQPKPAVRLWWVTPATPRTERSLVHVELRSSCILMLEALQGKRGVCRHQAGASSKPP